MSFIKWGIVLKHSFFLGFGAAVILLCHIKDIRDFFVPRVDKQPKQPKKQHFENILEEVENVLIDWIFKVWPPPGS